MAAIVNRTVLLSFSIQRMFRVPCLSKLIHATAQSCAKKKRSKSRSSYERKIQDPRKSTAYPFTPGDPVQESMIRSSESRHTASQKRANYLDESESRVVDYLEQVNTLNQQKRQILFQQSVKESNDGLTFETLKEGDVRLGRAVLAVKSSLARDDRDSILLEGQRLIADALRLGAKAKCLYFSDFQILKSIPRHLLHDVPLYKISYRDMKIWSDTVTPSGLLGIFKKPEQGDAVSKPERTLPLTVILDGMKDPGNAGTMIRTAAAIGCQQLMAVKGSVNLWEMKVLRTAMSGHFSVPIYTGLSWKDIQNRLPDKALVFLADSRPPDDIKNSFVDHIDEEDNITNSDDETEEDVDIPSGFKDSSSLQVEQSESSVSRAPLPVHSYDALSEDVIQSMCKDTSDVHFVLVLGSESHGLSTKAREFAYQHYGHYLTIPMINTMDSLNASVAGSIILYELRRKLLEQNR